MARVQPVAAILRQKSWSLAEVGLGRIKLRRKRHRFPGLVGARPLVGSLTYLAGATTAAASPSPQTPPGPRFCLSDSQRTHDTPGILSSSSSHAQSAKKTASTVTLPNIIRRMASSAAQPSVVPPKDLESFQQHLTKSTRILALLGAGLSASSGLPTFRGAGGMWRTHDATSLATPQAFERDPGLVWQFYSYRRHMALKAKPNPAHYALAELAKKKEQFITLSQNVDGKSLPQTPAVA